jgi:hypothetical protein
MGTETLNQDQELNNPGGGTDPNHGTEAGADTGTGNDEGTPSIAEDQIEIMSDVMDLAGDRTPADPEPKGRPGDAEVAGAEKEKGAQAPDARTKEDAKGDKGNAGKPAEQGKEGQGAEQDQMIEVPTDDGVRQVPLKNLVTTYNQHKHLQAQHAVIKPILDLAKQSRVPVDKILPVLELGIRTAMQNSQGGGQAPSGTAPTGQGSGQYQGPFKDAEEDARIKEIDPSLHHSQWNLFNQLQQTNRMVAQMTSNMRQAGRPDSGRTEAFSAMKNLVEKKITDFAGEHKDYFAVDPSTKSSPRLELFKLFLAKHYGHLDIEHDLTPQMLGIAFNAFDPGYVEKHIQAEADKKRKELLAQERATFGESSSARSGVPAQNLNDQQEIMADIL